MVDQRIFAQALASTRRSPPYDLFQAALPSFAYDRLASLSYGGAVAPIGLPFGGVGPSASLTGLMDGWRRPPGVAYGAIDAAAGWTPRSARGLPEIGARAAQPTPAYGQTSPSYGVGARPAGDTLTRDEVMRWLPQVQAAAGKYGVPVEMVLTVISNESGGDPRAQSAYNPNQGYARGLMQVMPYHFGAGDDPFDPITNIDRGTKFLADMYHRYGQDPDKTMAAYFGGPGAIDAQGNIRRNLGDMNITIGAYLDRKWRPALAAYSARLRGGQAQARPQQPARPGTWDYLVPGGTGRVERGGTHGGYPAIDIFAPAGTPIYAPVDGVSQPGQFRLGGNATTLRGADGRWYYFAHARDPMRGGAVRRGEIIGYVGNSGNARDTASHLHYAVASHPDIFGQRNGSGDIDPEAG